MLFSVVSVPDSGGARRKTPFPSMDGTLPTPFSRLFRKFLFRNRIFPRRIPTCEVRKRISPHVPDKKDRNSPAFARKRETLSESLFSRRCTNSDRPSKGLLPVLFYTARFRLGNFMKRPEIIRTFRLPNFRFRR